MTRPLNSNFTKHIAERWLGQHVCASACFEELEWKKSAADELSRDFIVRTNEIENYDVDPKEVKDGLDAVAQGYPVSYATQDKHILAQLRMLQALDDIGEIDTKAVQELHRLQGPDVLDHGSPGHLRNTPSGNVGGMKYAEPEQLGDAMAWWEKQEFDSPFQKVAVLMQIHPFGDGNGRMGRMVLLKLNDMDVEKTLKEVGPGYFKRLRDSVEDAGVSLDAPPWKGDTESTTGDWDAFMRQRYEGGHKQVRNPNQDPGAKETVSVNYLMRHHPQSAQAQHVRREYQVWKGSSKTAKATGTKCGNGESVGLFIPLPKDLAEKFPSLGQEDTSPSHVTFLYIGDFKCQTEQGALVEKLQEICRKWWPMCNAVLDKLEYFDHHDKDRRVPHVSVQFDKDLSGFKHRVKQELADAGIKCGDKFPEFKPHVTLAYMPGMDAEWEGKIPKGQWSFDEMEIWGLPKVHKIKLGPQAKTVAAHWLRSKIAGWWRITPENPGVNLVPDKPANACPGGDPVQESYNGDGPADVMGDTFANINQQYLDSWGRPAKPEEMKAVFDFVYGGFERGPEHYLPKGKEITMRVASRYLEKFIR